MSPVDVSQAMPLATEADFDRWLDAYGGVEREVVVAIHNKASGRPPVGLSRYRRWRSVMVG